MITIIPTKIMTVLAGIRLVRKAPSGAAATPPSINPKIILMCVVPIIAKNVMELANATKNSVRFTEPMVYRGAFPCAIKVDETIGPQPPPPTASRNPPVKASGNNLRTLFLI